MAKLIIIAVALFALVATAVCQQEREVEKSATDGKTGDLQTAGSLYGGFYGGFPYGGYGYGHGYGYGGPFYGGYGGYGYGHGIGYGYGIGGYGHGFGYY